MILQPVIRPNRGRRGGRGARGRGRGGRPGRRATNPAPAAEDEEVAASQRRG